MIGALFRRRELAAARAAIAGLRLELATAERDAASLRRQREQAKDEICELRAKLAAPVTAP